MRKITLPLSLQHIFQQQILHSVQIKKQVGGLHKLVALAFSRRHALSWPERPVGPKDLEITAPQDTTVRLGHGFQLGQTELSLKPNEPHRVTRVKCTLCSN